MFPSYVKTLFVESLCGVLLQENERLKKVCLLRDRKHPDSWVNFSHYIELFL